MADSPKPKELEITIGKRKERVRCEITPGSGDKAHFVMLRTEDPTLREMLSSRELSEELKQQVEKQTGLDNPVIGVQGLRTVIKADGGVKYV